MKTGRTFAALIAATLVGTAAFGQVQEDVRKDVRMEEENGVKTLYITTTTNGVSKEEIYTGEEAEMRLADEMDGRGLEEMVRKEVQVTEENGEKTVTIITSTKGKIRTEVYTGAEAEAKLLELKEAEGEMDGDAHQHQSVQPSENK